MPGKLHSYHGQRRYQRGAPSTVVEGGIRIRERFALEVKRCWESRWLCDRQTVEKTYHLKMHTSFTGIFARAVTMWLRFTSLHHRGPSVLRLRELKGFGFDVIVILHEA